MEEILEMYVKVVGGANNQEIYNYESINIHFANRILNVYTIQGDMPNRYKLPPNREEFIILLDDINKKYTEVIDNNQYICSKCQEVFDLPAAKKNKFGFMACNRCSDGGDLRGDQQESEIPSTTKDKPNVKSAIRLRQNHGYVVKQLAKSYKVVYRDTMGKEHISDNYYANKDDFKKSRPQSKFISFIKQLSEQEEVDLDDNSEN